MLSNFFRRSLRRCASNLHVDCIITGCVPNHFDFPIQSSLLRCGLELALEVPRPCCFYGGSIVLFGSRCTGAHRPRTPQAAGRSSGSCCSSSRHCTPAATQPHHIHTPQLWQDGFHPAVLSHTYLHTSRAYHQQHAQLCEITNFSMQYAVCCLFALALKSFQRQHHNDKCT